MKVAVGSTNPVKIEAVKEAFTLAFGKVEVISLEVSSGVPDQPFGAEVVRGAMNRAREALSKSDADFGVGIEGGVIQFYGKYYNLGFVAIVDRNGNVGTGTSGWFECPKGIVEKLKEGKELGSVMDELTGDHDTKRKQGAIGIFTRGLVDRKTLYVHGILMALCRFLSPEFFRV